MRKSIVITTIFEPTEAVKAFSILSDYELIVVADKKSVGHWNCNNVTYLTVQDQAGLDFKLIKELPYNHYSRKMVGYLVAMRNQAELIIDTDDDNIPKPGWNFPACNGTFDCLGENAGFVNIYQLFTKQKIWPRGLPLSLINTTFDFDRLLTKRKCRVGVWQGLADEDPDVDAIYRLTNDTPCYFENRDPVVLSRGTISPFNSQNTATIKELFPLLYLPTYVTFRFTDILRGLVAQPIMWLYGYDLGFVDATVVQKRNPHDYVKDFISELPMYEHCTKIIDIVGNAITLSNTLTDNVYLAYEALLRSSIVPESELQTLGAWLEDIKVLQRSYSI